MVSDRVRKSSYARWHPILIVILMERRRKNPTRPAIVVTKQTEKKHKTAKTSSNKSPRKTKHPGNILPSRGAQIMFYVTDSKIVVSYVRSLPNYIFMSSWPKLKNKQQKLIFRG